MALALYLASSVPTESEIKTAHMPDYRFKHCTLFISLQHDDPPSIDYVEIEDETPEKLKVSSMSLQIIRIGLIRWPSLDVAV